jgi:L-glutamine-phosphate cytidylyltransferase
MKAIILAAGRGSRMKNLTDENPKCLIELRGKPLLEWQLDAIRGAGINDIAIVTGYKREMLIGRGLKEFNNPRWDETNMVSSLTCAEEWLIDGPCIVSYSDIFYDSLAVRTLMKTTESLAVTYDPNWLQLWKKRFGDPLLDAETFGLNKYNYLTEIGQKPRTVDEVKGQYMGLLRFTLAGWQELVRIRSGLATKELDAIHMTGALQKIIDEGKINIAALAYTGEWGEIDSEQDLLCYQK